MARSLPPLPRLCWRAKPSSAAACRRRSISRSRHLMRRCAPDTQTCRKARGSVRLKRPMRLKLSHPPDQPWHRRPVTLSAGVCVSCATEGADVQHPDELPQEWPLLSPWPAGTDGGGRAGAEGGAGRAIHLGRMLQLPSGGCIAPAGERKPDQRGPVGSRHQRACYLLEWARLVRSLFLAGLHGTAKCL